MGVDFEPTLCKCGGVVFDALAGFRGRGLLRPICPKCGMRVWIRFSAEGLTVLKIDRRPARLPRDPARQRPPTSDNLSP